MIWRCPRCRGELAEIDCAVACEVCGVNYQSFEGIPDLPSGAELGRSRKGSGASAAIHGRDGRLVNRQMPVVEKVRAADEFAGRTLLLLLAALPVVLFPRLLIELLFTSAFAPAATTLFLFVVWQCVFQMANVYQQLLIGLDDVLFMAIATAVCYGSAALFGFFLIPALGIGGAAAGLGAGMLLYGIAAAARLRFRHGIGVSRRVVLRAASVIAVIVVAGLLGRATPETAARGIGMRASLVALGLGIIWLLLEREERRVVRTGPAALWSLFRVRADR